MQASLRLDNEGGEWQLLDHAGKPGRRAEFAWATPLRPNEQLLFIRGNGLFSVARAQRIVHSAAMAEDTWDDDFWRLPPGTTSRVRGQRVGAPLFADDFAHAEGEFGLWQATGGWSIEALRNPLRSANAFRLLGARTPATLTTGRWFWRNYRFSVSVRCHGNDAFSLLAHRSGPDATYELAVVQTGTQAVLRLLRRCGGQTEELGRHARPPLLFWNRLALSVHEDSIAASVNGQTVLRCVDAAPLAAGGIGLRLQQVGASGIEFDDALVSPVEVLNWSPTARPAPRLITVDGNRRTVLSPRLRDCTVQLDLPSSPASQLHGTELLSRLTPGGRGLRLAVVAGDEGQTAVSLEELMPGAASIRLGSASLPSATPVGELCLHARDAETWITVDGSVLVSVAGVGATGAGSAALVLPPSFDKKEISFQVRPNHRPSDLRALDHAFASERSMEVWSVEASEWQRSAETDASVATWMHRSDLWSDFRASLPLGNESGVTALLLYRDSDDPASPSVSLSVRGQGLVLESEAQEREIACALPATVECERRSDQLVLRAEGRVLGTIQIADGSFWRLGLQTSKPLPEWLPGVSVGASDLKDYTFRKAPVDWLPTAGRWTVTNRWQCDPRWSFYTGRNLAGPAVNWFRFLHGRNVTLEFFAGPRMNRESGSNYDYARDINATIGATSQDLGSGYSFLFGGKGNTTSQILQGERVLHDNPDVRIPEVSALVHRHWFHVKIRKQGGRLAWWVDGTKVGEAQVEQDVEAGRLALWTQRNQIAVARVRVSSDSLTRASPDAERGAERLVLHSSPVGGKSGEKQQ